MINLPKQEKRSRSVRRNLTEVTITCRPYGSSSATFAADGVMRNFSSQGSYIEIPRQFPSGTILLVRMLRIPATVQFESDEAVPRLIGLAEVKWFQKLANESTDRYGIGLSYLR